MASEIDMTSVTINPEEMDSGEEAVRKYLILMNDPDALVPTHIIEEIQAELKSATDPIERLDLRSQIDRLSEPPSDEIIEAFVAHAREWAGQEAVTAEALIHEGAQPEHLRRAGFALPQRVVRRGKGKSSSPTKRVSRDEVEESILSKSKREPFGVADVQNDTGASSSTARQVIGSLMEAGKVREAEVDHVKGEGPGRKPKMYQVL